MSTFINRNGLKFETYLDEQGVEHETGKIIGLEVDLLSNSQIALPHKRKAELLSITDEIDLEMLVNCRINYYNTDNILMTIAIDSDETLSEDAKAMRKQLFSSYTIKTKATRGSFVNPANGNIVTKDFPNAIPELLFYQSITKDMLIGMGIITNSENRPQIMRYKTLAYMINTIITRNGL